MNLKEIFEAYLKLLWEFFQYDMEVFSKPWIYIALLIPATLYFVFFILKWIVLTAPIWLPIRMIISPFFSLKKTKKEKAKS